MISGKSISNCNIGTLCYSSPEVLKNEEYDCRTDLWSLGCIIFELCTFSMPFNSTNERSLIDKICIQKIPVLPSTYSLEMKQVYEQCICRSKNNRPSSKELLGSASKFLLFLTLNQSYRHGRRNNRSTILKYILLSSTSRKYNLRSLNKFPDKHKWIKRLIIPKAVCSFPPKRILTLLLCIWSLLYLKIQSLK